MSVPSPSAKHNSLSYKKNYLPHFSRCLVTRPGYNQETSSNNNSTPSVSRTLQIDWKFRWHAPEHVFYGLIRPIRPGSGSCPLPFLPIYYAYFRNPHHAEPNLQFMTNKLDLMIGFPTPLTSSLTRHESWRLNSPTIPITLKTTTLYFPAQISVLTTVLAENIPHSTST